MPEDIRGLYKGLQRNGVQLDLICKENRNKNNSIKTKFIYKNIIDLIILIFKYLKSNKPDFIILIGFFIYDNLIVLLACKLFRLTTILFPFGHFMKNGLKEKIFVSNPDIKYLESKKFSSIRFFNFKIFIQNFKSRILKYFFIKTLGTFMIKLSSIVSLFSKEEHNDFIRLYPRIKKKFIYTPMGITMSKTVKRSVSKTNFYTEKLKVDPSFTKFLYWGRVDWHIKGIDRLLNAIKEINFSDDYQYEPFKLFIIGPDYRNSFPKLKLFIKKNKLEDIVFLISSDMYEKGSIDPLRDADVNILLSRWDGFPRTLRESTIFEVPMLVSEETNFGDLVRNFQAGIVAKNPDNVSELILDLAFISKSNNRNLFKNGSKNLSNYLEWDNIAKDLKRNLLKFKNPNV